MMTDPIGDMLARIRNAGRSGHPEVRCPSSKIKLAIARVLEQEGFLSGVRVEARDGHAELVVLLRYGAEGEPLLDGIRRVSRPSRRIYVGAEKIPRVRGGLGVAILSTSKGILSDRSARAEKVGGELLCEVW